MRLNVCVCLGLRLANFGHIQGSQLLPLYEETLQFVLFFLWLEVSSE